ncbi:uncharacterized protein TEOVI_000732900 [Trypanosoma equiperdum]|uniref:Uncharacterized protein n=2 Tax=Trypanozoon TaxID=39700 RepID=Q382M6_TRYB2|nr:hypothetical protein, conserved [Trypanosoma brucei brucei TREU927]EAN80255.1 hypothetical protein, conserved [Trypanosoma brucei brucei TREU927]SCU65554.1 hypothetical protein, conserved [Trypanosoma equiperdum]
MQQKKCYTREELLALRSTLRLDTFPNPIKVDCPMLTDCELELHETRVTKRQKVDWSPQVLGTKLVSVVSGSDSCLGTVCESGAPVVQRDGFGECVVVGSGVSSFDGCADASSQSRRAVVPPRLHVPIVTIDGPVRGKPSNVGGSDLESRASFDTERGMVARLRELQERRKQGQREPPNRSCWSQALGSKIGTDSVKVRVCSSLQPKCSFRNHGSSATPPASADKKDRCGASLPIPEAEAAVPMANVSLFKSSGGSRYFQFTRTLGLWEYLTTHSGLGSLSGTQMVSKKEANTDANNSSSGVQSSVGPDEFATPSASRREGESASDKAVVPATRKPHRRRTNRTYAEKRAHRDAQQSVSTAT